ncbi:hypothetical protein [Neobacillus sp.]|uniref:hypothetical protein n=1 Tax=Neobacillus sp. TaxID=2675273 RepID=UPI0035B55C31
MRAEIMFLQAVSFDYKNPSKGIKKENINKSPMYRENLRIFFNCDNCDYVTDNLWSGSDTIRLSYPELLPFEKDIQLIMEQISEMVDTHSYIN